MPVSVGSPAPQRIPKQQPPEHVGKSQSRWPSMEVPWLVNGVPLVIVLGAIGTHFLPDTTAVSALAKVAFPALALGVLPGALALSLALPSRRFSAFELAGLGGVLS